MAGAIQTIPEPSEADALAALKQLLEPESATVGGPEPGVVSTGAIAPEPVEPVAQAAPTQEPPPEPVVGEVEDVASLKARLDSMSKDFESLRGKTSTSLEWSRNLALRTATERDRLKQALRTIREKGEVPAEDIDRLLRDDNTRQPLPGISAQPPTDETAAMEALRFSVDNNINDEAAGNFDAWIRAGNAKPNDIIEGRPYDTLQILWSRYQRESTAVSPQTVAAAQSIAKTQRAAARAAGPPVSRAPAAPPADKQEDLMALIEKDPDAALKSGLIEKLFRAVNEGSR